MSLVAALLGPTAAGKSEAALAVAAAVGAEIVSVDSMQVYRGMDIGTAKPRPAEQARVRHHLIDLVDPATSFSVAGFQRAGRAVLADLAERGVPALVVGGSGLHFRALVDPLEFPPHDPAVRRDVEAVSAEQAAAELLAADPAVGARVDLANPRRVARALEVYRLTGATPSARFAGEGAAAVRAYLPLLPVVAVGLDPGEALRTRVEERLDAMLAAGLLEEVARLAPRLGRTAAQAVGYKQLLPVVRGEASLEEGRARAAAATWALARRQRTFFQRDPRIRWLRWDDEAVRREAAARIALEEAGWTS
ncbi:MAG: tRNA (adenosine(37)-N6)-dimethylallyltransferase MiaA [Acidimicrobiia bacterium]|nr:tRNA (adenosine(37)-N6)-dimethylallyltransferase MiaA [Acidimicrobiia bacterium]